jgi:DNA-binding NtrC family response regulator
VDRLASYFVAKFAREGARPIQGLDAQALAAIRAYPWPGNIRELIATARRAVVMADGPWVRPEDLGLPEDAPRLGCAISLEEARRETEETLIRRALADHRSNIKRTAEHLGVSRVTLYRMLEKYGIQHRG